MYLTGSKKHSLDAKLRLTLPAEYRREFDTRVCLLPLKDAVFGFTPEAHKAYVESQFPHGYSATSRRDVALRRGLNGATVTVDIDSAGRVALSKLPDAERERLGLSGEVMVVGNDDHFEVWNPATWQEINETFAEDLDALMFEDSSRDLQA